MNKKIIDFIFFGNYFYALCVVALSVEASLQQGIPLNTPVYYILLASGTIVYYSYAYLGQINYGKALRSVRLPLTARNKNPYYSRRTQWYIRNYFTVTVTQILFGIIMFAAALYLCVTVFHEIFSLHWDEWLALLIIPCVAMLYYGGDYFSFIKINLRKTGWLKPFIIGLVWAGVVTVYPVMFYKWQINRHYQITVEGLWFFIKNFMYITVLCIMFDIKDYADDYNKHLKTFVVRAGLRKTIFFILLPLIFAGLAALWLFASQEHFGIIKVLINTVPFVCLLFVAYSLRRRKKILYYLIIIDGLMLLKAVCGIIASLLPGR